MVKTLLTNAGDADSTSGSEGSLRRGKNNPLQYSCLENSMDKGAWQATVYGVTNSWLQLSTQQQKQHLDI